MAELRLKAAVVPGCFLIPADFNNHTIELFAARANGLAAKGSNMILVPSKGMGIETAKTFARKIRAILETWDTEPFGTTEPSSYEDTAPPEPAPAPKEKSRSRKAKSRSRKAKA